MTEYIYIFIDENINSLFFRTLFIFFVFSSVTMDKSLKENDHKYEKQNWIDHKHKKPLQLVSGVNHLIEVAADDILSICITP